MLREVMMHQVMLCLAECEGHSYPVQYGQSYQKAASILCRCPVHFRERRGEVVGKGGKKFPKTSPPNAHSFQSKSRLTIGKVSRFLHQSHAWLACLSEPILGYKLDASMLSGRPVHAHASSHLQVSFALSYEHNAALRRLQVSTHVMHEAKFGRETHRWKHAQQQGASLHGINIWSASP